VFIAGDPPASSVVRVTYWPEDGEAFSDRCEGRPSSSSSVEQLVGRQFIVFVNQSATVVATIVATDAATIAATVGTTVVTTVAATVGDGRGDSSSCL